MSNSLRITGLASGIDTEEMIQKLMQAEKVKVDRVEQDRQVLLWRQEMYNSINKDFANLILNSRKMFGLTSIRYDGTLMPNSYQNLNWVKKATSSNESVATVSSTGKAMDGNYSVKVERLAKGVNMASGDKIGGTGSIKDILGDEYKDADKLEFEINGKKFVVGKIQKDGNGEISDPSINPITKDGEIIGYEEAFIDGDLDSIKLNDVVKLINSAKFKDGEGKDIGSVGIRTSYDAGIDRLFLQTTETGEDIHVEITAASGSVGEKFINALKLTKEDGSSYKIGDKESGQNALVDFNGANGIESSSNRITVNGITMELKSEGDFNVTVATDVDGIYEKVEQFVKEYNELVDKTNKLLGEKRYRDYKPLTSDQKKAMEKADIELWEEKAKSGLLRSDSLISATMLKTRQSIYEEFKVEDGFSGAFKLITEIGISTEKYSRGDAGGKLVIDEEKLKNAIANNPEAVMELLFKESVPAEKDENGKVIKEGKSGGLVTRIHDNLMLGMEDIIKKSGTGDEATLYRGVKGNILLDFVSKYSSISLIEKDVLKYNQKIDDLNVMLFKKENNYYAKFAAMEKAISRMNQQNSWLMQQAMN
jgi:flagellar hook-associated protein 2